MIVEGGNMRFVLLEGIDGLIHIDENNENRYK